MSKKVLFIIDEVENLNPLKDTSLLMIKNTLKLGHQVSFCSYREITFVENKPVSQIKVLDKFDEKLSNYVEKKINMESLDYIFIRKDPPFNKDYLFLTHLLKFLKKTIVINNPETLCLHNEKLSILKFPNLIPKTLVSCDPNQINNFIKKYKKIVCKPIDEMAGNKIFLLEESNFNNNVTLEVLTENWKTQIILQKYIPEIKNGDKRIILIKGTPIPYGLLRIPMKNDFRGNLAKGGVPKISALNKDDLKIIETIRPYLIKNNLNFVGIDVIGKYLTEINVTSPTGLVEIEKLTKKNVTKKILQNLL
jgi:glutathione synthase